MKDRELLDLAAAAQNRIEESGIREVSVETEDSEVLAAISRIFGVETGEITFDMFKECIRYISRAGTITGYENA